MTTKRKKYVIWFYNSLTKDWRKGRTFVSKPKAAAFAAEYFASIIRDDIFGEADKLYLAYDDTYGGVQWVYKARESTWKKLGQGR